MLKCVFVYESGDVSDMSLHRDGNS